MTDDDSTPFIAELCTALAPGSFVTRFVVVAEVIGEDGDRAVIVDADPGATEWDMQGLLRWALKHGTTQAGDDYDED